MKIYIIRHGQSEGNANPDVYFSNRDHTLNLTDLGKEQATVAGGILKREIADDEKVQIHVSPYIRTRQTWQTILKSWGERNVEWVEENPLLREQEYRSFANSDHVKLTKEKRVAFGPFFYRFRNAESVADVYQRIQSFINSIMLRKLLGQVEGTQVIVTHEVVIRMFLMIFQRLRHEDAKIDIKNCEVICLTLDEKMNCTSIKKFES